MNESFELESLLSCPICKGQLQNVSGSFTCEKCRATFRREDSIPVFIDPSIYENGSQYNQAHQRGTFWDMGWKSRLQGDHRHLLKMGPDQLKQFLLEWKENYEDDNPRFIEAGPSKVRNKVVLDIGCGAFLSSALFAYFGANYIGLDISHAAAALSLSSIHKLSGKGITIQADAEALPFRDDSIEFVYSDGVLHHTPHMMKAFQEVYRVLKPGGEAVISLYASHSFMFMQKRIEVFLHGQLTKEAQARWMSRETENDWRTRERKNEWTITLSKQEIENLLAPMSWERIHIRRSAFYWSHVRIVGRLIKLLKLEKRLRFSERLLTPLLGGMWVISLIKPPARNASH
jgi:ubiquinone/menaquinone biosynthesis C-methylase UbiE/uncharacterized protein YbaR (Trm112 family)